MRNRTVIFMASVALALCLPSVAQADPVTIVSGDIVYSRQNAATFNLNLLGGGLLSGSFGTTSESQDPPHFCLPCTSGTFLDPSLSESILNSPVGETSVAGFLTMDGTYPLMGLGFTIEAGDVLVPNLTDGQTTSTAARFTFGGTATAANGETRFTGQGTVTMNFAGQNWDSTRYQFDSAAPVPEPASMLLLGTGLAGLAARRRFNRRPA